MKITGFANFCTVCEDDVELPELENCRQQFYEQLKNENSRLLCLFFLCFPHEYKETSKIYTSDSLVSFCCRCASLLREWDDIRHQLKFLERRATVIRNTLTAIIIQTATEVRSKHETSIGKFTETTLVSMQTKVKTVKQLVSQDFSPSVLLACRCDEGFETTQSQEDVSSSVSWDGIPAYEDAQLSVKGRTDVPSEEVKDAIPMEPKRRRKDPLGPLRVDPSLIEITTFGPPEQGTLEKSPTVTPEVDRPPEGRLAVFSNETTTEGNVGKPKKKVLLVVKKPIGLPLGTAVAPEAKRSPDVRPAAVCKQVTEEGKLENPKKKVLLVAKRPLRLPQDGTVTLQAGQSSEGIPAACSKETLGADKFGKFKKKILLVKKPVGLPQKTVVVPEAERSSERRSVAVSNEATTESKLGRSFKKIILVKKTNGLPREARVTPGVDRSPERRPVDFPENSAEGSNSGKSKKNVLLFVKNPMGLRDGKYCIGDQHYLTINDGRCHCDECQESFTTMPDTLKHLKQMHDTKAGGRNQINFGSRSSAYGKCLPTFKENLIRPNSSSPTTRGRKKGSKATRQPKNERYKLVSPGTYLYDEKYEIRLQEGGKYVCMTCERFEGKLLSQVGRHVRRVHARVRKERLKKTKAPGEAPRRRRTKPPKENSGATSAKTSKLLELIEPGKYLHRGKYEINLADDQLFLCSTCDKYRSSNLRLVAWHIDRCHDEYIRIKRRESYSRRQLRKLRLKLTEDSPGKYTYREVGIERQENGEFVCMKCGKTVSKLSGMKIHIGVRHVTVLKRRPMKPVCIGPDKYEYDGRTYTRDPAAHKYFCDLCSHTCMRERKLIITHLITAHGAARPRPVTINPDERSKPVSKSSKPAQTSRHMCLKCNKSYASLFGLTLHKQNVHSPISFICELCGRGFKNRYAYKNHAQIHLPSEERRKYQCEHFGSVYTQPSYLKSHMQMKHTGELLPCKLCDQRFPTVAQLHIHRRVVHHGLSRMCTCQFCAKEFRNEWSWKYHEKTHTGETFDCAECDLKFPTVARRRDHFRKIHRQTQTSFECGGE